MTAITITQYRNALYTFLTAQEAATPTLLRKVLRFRPGAIAESPVAWIGDIVDDLAIDAGTRAHTMTGEVIIGAPYPTDILTDNDPFDNLRDALIERLTAATAAVVIANSVFELTSIADGDLSLQGADRVTTYRGMTLSTRLRIWEGRD